MKMIKRLLALSLALAIAVSMAACGSQAPAAGSSAPAAPESSSSSVPGGGESASQADGISSQPSSSGTASEAASKPQKSSSSASEESSPASEKASQSPASQSAAGGIPDFMLPGAGGESSGGSGGGSGSGGDITVTISVECSEAEGYDIPCEADILDATLTMKSGSTVYNALKTATKEAGIAVAGSSSYIKGIAGLYEKDCDGQGGWTYTVNGEFPSVGCGSYKLSDGDSILWSYVLDTGSW